MFDFRQITLFSLGYILPLKAQNDYVLKIWGAWPRRLTLATYE